jgi:hypothetical protein
VIVKEVVNKCNHSIQNLLVLVTEPRKLDRIKTENRKPGDIQVAMWIQEVQGQAWGDGEGVIDESAALFYFLEGGQARMVEFA